MHAFFLFLPMLAFAASPDWAELLHQGRSARVHFGAAVGGNTSYLANEDESFAPASTAKLFTAGALLAAVGPEYRYATRLRWTETAPGVASEVTLVGAGDPSWGANGDDLRAHFDRFAAALQQAGISTVQGEPRAEAADARWDERTVPAGWKGKDSAHCDGALAQAFNVNFNCAPLTVSSPAEAEWKAPGLDFPVRNEVHAGPRSNVRAHFNGTEYVLRGTMRPGQRPVTFLLPIHDTRAWVNNLFREALFARGLRAVPVSAPARGVERQIVFYSAPLRELVKPFLKNSVNVLGDAFLKTLATLRGPMSGEASLLPLGLERLTAYLNQFGDEFELHDGSGLSRTSRVTPRFMMRFLEKVAGAPYFAALYDGLPVAGVDGTLKDRMKGTAADGLLRGKTGTLDGVYNLAGWVPGANGFVPYALLTRGSLGFAAAARAAADRVGAGLAELYSPPAMVALKQAEASGAAYKKQ